MIVLGLIFVIAAAALGTGVVLDGGESASVEIFGTTVDTTVAGVFFTGAATMLVFVLGLWLIVSATGRARRKRLERKDARKRQRASVAALEDERTQLRAENERLHEQLGTQDAPRPDTRADGRGLAGERTTVDGHRSDGDATTTTSRNEDVDVRRAEESRTR